MADTITKDARRGTQDNGEAWQIHWIVQNPSDGDWDDDDDWDRDGDWDKDEDWEDGGDWDEDDASDAIAPTQLPILCQLGAMR